MKICLSIFKHGKMRKLRMAKKIFQRPVFYKRLTYITLICNHKVAAVHAYLRNTFFANFENCSKDIFGGSVVQWL